MKKFLMALCACTMIGANMNVQANSEKNTENSYVYGTIESVNENHIHLTNDSDSYNDIVLNVNENTVIMDAVTGKEIAFEELDENEVIAAYVSNAMTRSLPPITNATVIIAHIPADYRVPHYYKVKEIVSNEKGVLRVLDTNESLIATIGDETEIFKFHSDEKISIDDIKEGSELMLWYEIMTLSYPGQTYAKKAMLLPEKNNGWVQVENDWFYFVDGMMSINKWIPSTSTRWYYVGEDGKMVTNTIVDGYEINEKGIYESKE